MYPSEKDVLFGRGRPYQEYPGNQHLYHLVKIQKDHYRLAEERLDKLCISAHVVKAIQESGGRFLRRVTSEGWVEVTDAEARQKVVKALRRPNEQEAKILKANTTAAASRIDGGGGGKRARCGDDDL